MIGVLENILPDTLHARSKGDSVCAAFRTFKTFLSIPDHYSSTPLLQQPRDLRARFWPPSREFQTKPRPLGVGSVFSSLYFVFTSENACLYLKPASPLWIGVGRPPRWSILPFSNVSKIAMSCPIGNGLCPRCLDAHCSPQGPVCQAKVRGKFL